MEVVSKSGSGRFLFELSRDVSKIYYWCTRYGNCYAGSIKKH